MATLLPLSTVEPALVEALLDAACATDQHARTAYRIRAGMEWMLGPWTGAASVAPRADAL